MLLERKTYVVKEHVAFAKLTATYDLLDAESGAPIGIAKEEPPGWAKWMRLVANKHMLPTAINVYEGPSTTPLVSAPGSPWSWATARSGTSKRS
jgi:hypothetical protein